MANETTTKFKVDISELKKGIQDANRQIKLANAEFKAASASMENWGKNADGLSAKISQTEKVLKAQKTILRDYEKQLALIVSEYGESSKEADEMRIKIENQRATVIKTEKSLGDYKSKLAELEAEQKKAGGAYDALKAKIAEQEKQLESLKAEYANVVLEQGKNSAAAKALGKQIYSLSGELKDNKKALSDADSAADDLDNTLVDTEKSAKDAGKGFTVFKGVLADLVASGIKAAISGLKDLASTAKESFKEFDEGRDAVIKATGATGEAAKELQNSYSEVAKSVVGDFGDIGSALGEVNTRFGYTGKELEDATTKFMKFADITGTDATKAVQLVSRAMGDAGIDSSEYASVLDDLAIAAQASGISVDKLTELLTSYGAPMRTLGFETRDAIAIFSQWEKAGVNTQTAFSGMKAAIGKWSKEGKDAKAEFGNVLKEIGKAPNIASATTKAIEAFGQKAGPDLADAIQGGRFEYEEFLKIIEGSEGTVENTFNETQDATDKVKLAFQGMKVSLGETVSDIVDKYGPDIEKAIGAIIPVVQKLISWFAEIIPPAIETVKGAFSAIAPVVQSVYDTVKPVFDKIAELIKSAFGWIIDNKDVVIAALAGIGAAIVAWNIATVVTNIVKMVKAIKMMGAASAFAAAKQWLLNTALLANPIGLIVAAIAGLVTAFVVLWKRSENFRNFWIGLWEKIKKAFSEFIDAWGVGLDIIKEALSKVGELFKGIWDSIQESASNLIENVVGFFSGAWEFIKLVWDVAVKYFSMIWENIKVVFSAVKNTLSGFFIAAWEAIKFVWDTVIGYFKMIWNNIKQIFTAVKAVLSGDFSGAWEAIKGIWDNAKSYFSGVWDGIKNVFAKIKDFFATAFSEAWKAIKGVFSNVGEFFGGIWDTIKERFSTIGTKIGEAVGGAFKLAINSVLATVEKGINFVPDAINKAIDLINALPGVEIPQMPNITLPRLEKGGILKRGQIGLLEGKGAEAVVPLEKNKAWIAATASELRKSLAGEGVIGGASGRKTGHGVVYNFNQYNNSPKALSRLEIYRQSKNLLSGVKAV